MLCPANVLLSAVLRRTLVRSVILLINSKPNQLIRKLKEPLMRIELTTSSLPRKCSTTELQRLDKFEVSG